MKKLFAIMLLCLHPMMLQAANYNWLNNAPVSYFTEQDWDLAKTAAKNLLELGKQGESASWDNPDSSNGGTYILLENQINEDQICHLMNVEHRAKTLKAEAKHVFCKQPDGSWKRP